MKITILTLGCRTNQAESLYIEKEALLKQHQVVRLNEDPDLCIINTCAVTAKADYQSRQLINRALKTKGQIIVTGCYGQLHIKELSEVKRLQLIPNNNKELIPNYFDSTSNITSHIHSRARPIIKIQEGCANECTYCTIPLSRGKGQSVSIDKVINEIQFYETQGFNEIVLTGTNIGAYEYEGYDLKRLLRHILNGTTIARLRISSIEINHIDTELIDIIGDKRICKHLHIPLQSGSDRVLTDMGRPYLRAEYQSKVLQLKALYPDISIGCDIIVGFPTEGQREFAETLDLLQQLPLSYIHVFTFSPRKGTLAASMRQSTNFNDIKKRSEALIRLSAYKREQFVMSQIGKVSDLIVEKIYPDKIEGTTNNYIKASIEPPFNVKEKSLIYIQLTKFNGTEVYGKPKI